MITLHQLTDTFRTRKKSKRVGRGPGSKLGKTCGRGEKGAGSRAGYTRRLGYEGGQFRLYMKLPIRGFSNANFRKEYATVNLGQIEQMFNDGEVVNAKTLKEKGFLSGPICALKILGEGNLSKKVNVEADAISGSAKEKLEKRKIPFTIKSKA
jgi:large subunit ribosomal protein L15